jgi:hypothetical protein
MAWVYSQSSGQLYTSDLNPIGAPGYSGRGKGLNNPAMQAVKMVGPIPQGAWQMVELLPESSHGPNAIRLEPMAGTVTFGRSGFFLHGDEIAHAGEHLASEGCIIEPSNVRIEMWNEPMHDLEVVANV